LSGQSRFATRARGYSCDCLDPATALGEPDPAHRLPQRHLGFAPLKTGSFHRGVACSPDFICADSGSNDVGPVPLGSGGTSSPLAWQTHDLEEMLLASRRLGVPMIIGSAGDTGANSRVDLFVGIIQELAKKHGLAKFRIGYFYSESTSLSRPQDRRRRHDHGLERPRRPRPGDSRRDRAGRRHGGGPPLHQAPRRRRRRHHRPGASSDCAIFAAPAIRAGFPEALAYFYGKVLECSSFCAEPYAGKESVLGEITMEDVKVAALLEEQRCTVASVAGHAMYERPNPFYEYFLGGHIDMSTCRYEQYDERTTRITGPSYLPATELRAKLEGSGKVGERFIGIVGVRDPYTIQNIDTVIDWARRQTAERFGPTGYELHYAVYGRNAILGDLEPLKAHPGHEVCVVVQGIAPTREMAEEVCMTGTRQMFYARFPR